MRGLAGLLLFCVSAFAQSAGDGMAYFEKNIRPLLVTNCYGCHSSKLPKPMGGLLLDSKAGMLRGGKSGAPAVIPGKPEESLILAAVRGVNKDLKMPPGKTLEPTRSTRWRSGSNGRSRSADRSRARRRRLRTIGRRPEQHWSFRPGADPAPPRVNAAEWNRSPWIGSSKRSSTGKAGPTAARHETGADPPRHLRSDRSSAHARRHGRVPQRQFAARVREGGRSAARLAAIRRKWGRHWLDVVRYADTAGDNADFPVPAMYRYRNWVIAAFNRDEPYDQFLREQIAGDILAAATRHRSEDYAAEGSSPPATWPIRAASARAPPSFTSPSTTPSTTSARACSA